jgi:capsid protein
MLMPQLCHRLGGWFLDAAAMETGRRPPADIVWTAPRREMIDPTKEIPASRAAIRAGLSSRSYEQRRLGFDPDDLDAEIAGDNARADRLGLIFDSDPRVMSQSGVVQQAVADPESDEE